MSEYEMVKPSEEAKMLLERFKKDMQMIEFLLNLMMTDGLKLITLM